MSEITRYDLTSNTRSYNEYRHMAVATDGEYVLHSDHLAAIAAKDAEIAALRDLLREVRDSLVAIISVRSIAHEVDAEAKAGIAHIDAVLGTQQGGGE